MLQDEACKGQGPFVCTQAAAGTEAVCLRLSRVALQVRNLELPERHELRKLQQLKEEAGEMTAADERKLRGLQRATEKEILQAADVVCVTCVGAGDLRLNNFRFRQVGPATP